MSSRDLAKSMIEFSKDNCDAARALRELLVLLVDRNFQEADDDEYSEEREEHSGYADEVFFHITTELTGGKRDLLEKYEWMR